jgi:hypothetical protein
MNKNASVLKKNRGVNKICSVTIDRIAQGLLNYPSKDSGIRIYYSLILGLAETVFSLLR